MTRTLFALAALIGVGCSGNPAAAPEEDLLPSTTRRMPAEWEPQAAVWLQWPQSWEGQGVEDAFVQIATAIADYEDVHLLATDAATEASGRAALGDLARVTWHVIGNDNSWMRDNGPRYVFLDGQLAVQDWGFDGWAGGFGDVPWALDNAVPSELATLLDLPFEAVGLVHERGDLEVNGVDTALVNWSVMGHRNPGATKAEVTEVMQRALGVDSVIYAEGFDPLDGTRGHIDGMARFVAEDAILVGDDGTALMDRVAAQISEQRPDLRVERLVSSDAASYLNFLVGNGFVLVATGSEDDVAREALQPFFPGRDIRFVDVEALWANGGGIHCVTNDQPVSQE